MGLIKDIAYEGGSLASWVEGEERFYVTRNAAGRPTRVVSYAGRWIKEDVDLQYSNEGEFIGLSRQLNSDMMQALLADARGTLGGKINPTTGKVEISTGGETLEIGGGAGIQPDATGTLAGRSTYDAEAEGFVYLATDQ
ncbi:MAG: hypothetical protein KC496_01490, partial [Anaerolineae bacterium]|nr:hypothetical protein [Anaerolineae bacterium]